MPLSIWLPWSEVKYIKVWSSIPFFFNASTIWPMASSISKILKLDCIRWCSSNLVKCRKLQWKTSPYKVKKSQRNSEHYTKGNLIIGFFNCSAQDIYLSSILKPKKSAILMLFYMLQDSRTSFLLIGIYMFEITRKIYSNSERSETFFWKQRSNLLQQAYDYRSKLIDIIDTFTIKIIWDK